MKKVPCEDCRMSRFCGTKSTYNNTPGWGNPDARLVIVLDAPGSPLAEKLLVWSLQKLSLTADDVWVDYLWKCPLPKQLKKKELEVTHRICWTSHPRAWGDAEDKVIVLAGNYSAEFLASAKMADCHGKKHITGIWIAYSFLYLLMNPAECHPTACVLYKAAEEAGLSPVYNFDVPPFRFPSKKLS